MSLTAAAAGAAAAAFLHLRLETSTAYSVLFCFGFIKFFLSFTHDAPLNATTTHTPIMYSYLVYIFMHLFVTSHRLEYTPATIDDIDLFV